MQNTDIYTEGQKNSLEALRSAMIWLTRYLASGPSAPPFCQSSVKFGIGQPTNDHLDLVKRELSRWENTLSAPAPHPQVLHMRK